MAPTPSEFRPRPILRALIDHGVDFVLIGGLAGMARGSSYPSYDLDILSDPDGAPPYDRLQAAAGPRLEFEGEQITVASLDHLIAMKEAAGRPKDKLMATEYRALSEELRAPDR